LQRTKSVVTPQRFGSGMTFAQYLDYVASPESLRREANEGAKRIDRSGQLRAWHDAFQLADQQTAALRWLAGRPNGPAKILAIAEEWSSDCRRDVPVFARMAQAADMELRIFPRDGERFSRANRPSLEESPNADLMAEFLNEKRGQTWQSIPVAAFFTKDFDYLYHYTEYPAIYEKDRIVYGHIRAALPGETPRQTQERSDKEFQALQQSPFFHVWASAAVDEMISALHRRVLLGAV
jgi:hypothetical protein